jgi:CRISPR/Cas system-associated exonuclease Cas4 (RecB family)
VNDVKRGILTMPFEVKTGHLKTPSNEDTCQVVMYSMMKNSETLPVVMKQEHYNTGGLLLYIQTGIIYHVSVEHKEKRDVVQKRNELVNYLTILKSESLPATINNDKLCQHCPSKVECAIYQVS